MKSLQFAFLLICVFATVCVSQQALTAVQVDEFYDINCEAQRANLDILLSELKAPTELYGVIILHGTPNNPLSPYQQKSTIINHLRFRGFDTNRIFFRLGKSEPRFRTEFWKSPAKEVDRFVGEPWNYKLTNLDGPILVYAQNWSDGIGCGLFMPDLKFYSEFLLANGDLVGRVVIREKSMGRYNTVKSKIIRDLKSKYKVAASRLEFAYVQSDWSDVEYWYVPRDMFHPAT